MRPGKDFTGVGGGALIINDENEVLLVRRAGKARDDLGLWSRPGGTLNFGESIVDAVKREVKEEVNVDIEIVRFLEYTEEINKNGEHWIAFGFLAKIVGGEPKNMEPHKHDEMKWFPLSKLPENLTVYTRNSINAYLNSK